MGVDVMGNYNEEAIFAGGCFWCMVGAFEALSGVCDVVSGYTGGHVLNPSYEQVCSDSTGHVEAVRIRFDSSQLSYSRLLDVFWRQIDPTDDGGQFADRGESYRSAIFYGSPEQKLQAEESRDRLQASGLLNGEIVTRILPASVFYPAEDYHQGFHRKEPERYQHYRCGSGREGFLVGLWGEGTDHG